MRQEAQRKTIEDEQPASKPSIAPSLLNMSIKETNQKDMSIQEEVNEVLQGEVKN